MTGHKLPTTISKTRFKLALECPRKLAYTSGSRYVSTHESDELLEALADGGQKVGALAKLMFPAGVEISARTTEAQDAETAKLLKHRDIVIFEATFAVGRLLARIDVLVKQGSEIQLVEVKSKGFNPDSDFFRSKAGGIGAGWRPYLYDVGFQTLVLRRAQPTWLQLSMNPSTGSGGACTWDSGGPHFIEDFSYTDTVASITVGGDAYCRATDTTYRLDTANARKFLSRHVTPPE